MAVSFFSCDEINETVLPRPSGKSGNLLIIADSAYWNGKTGETIMEVFAQTQEGLPQREPVFDLIQLPHHSFAQIFRTNRNIIIVDIKPENKNKLSINSDVWSETQLIATIAAPNDKVAAEMIEKNGKVLTDYFNEKEIERLKTKYSTNPDNPVAKQIRMDFKLRMKLDNLFVVAKRDKDFLWLRKEKNVGEHPVSQGLLIYSYPYVSDSTFKVSELVKKRNYYTKKYVEGSLENTYMQSYKEFVPIEKEISLNKLYAKELRGLWYLKGDFMGGPYINYTFVDEKRNRVICIDGYVYAPRFDKREYLRELEAFIKATELIN